MEVIPIDIVPDQEDQLVGSSRTQTTNNEQFRIRQLKSKRVSKLVKAYHPDDKALLILHEPNII
jgi:hypothetical protein